MTDKYPFNLLKKSRETDGFRNHGAALPTREDRLSEDGWPSDLLLTSSEHEPCRLEVRIGLLCDVVICIHHEGKRIAATCLDEARARRLRLFLDDYLDKYSDQMDETLDQKKDRDGT